MNVKESSAAERDVSNNTSVLDTTKSNSYHDVVVYVEGMRYYLTDNYAYVLTCTKSGGWELWERWKNSERLLGGEFSGKPFAIEIRGIMVLGNPPALLQSLPTRLYG